MGGFGSGFQLAAKAATDETDRLRIREWANRAPGLEVAYRLTRGGWLELGKVRVLTGHDSLTLTFTPPDSAAWQQTIRIARAPCTLGGSRPWFACPRCGRHCATLYRGRYGYACRTCNRLNYPSTRENAGDRAARRADKIRARLGWTPGILNGHEGKPKGMHWRTFERLVAEHDRYTDIFMRATWQRLRKMDARRERLAGQC